MCNSISAIVGCTLPSYVTAAHLKTFKKKIEEKRSFDESVFQFIYRQKIISVISLNIQRYLCYAVTLVHYKGLITFTLWFTILINGFQKNNVDKS